MRLPYTSRLGRRPVTRGSVVATMAVSLLTFAPALQATASPAPTAATATDRTSEVEARRVDRINVRIGWYPCNGVECATVQLPLDYDEPNGPTIPISMVRVKATNPSRRIGTLFWNPGGPSGPAAAFTPGFAQALGTTVRAQFDVIGIDPRGVGASARVKCFPSVKAQQTFLSTSLTQPFPFTDREEKQAASEARTYGAACSSTGQPLVSSMSTAETARDMDVIRRAVGDKTLTYLGFSYGTYLGQVYANLFPDRVRAIVLDGVLDPLAWTGTGADLADPVTDRLRSGDSGWHAVERLDKTCAALGEKACGKPGELVANFQKAADLLKASPVTLDPGLPPLTYAEFVSFAQSILAGGFDQGYLKLVVDEVLRSAKSAAAGSATPALQSSIVQRVRELRAKYGFFYGNDQDAYTGVLCTDSRTTARTDQFPAIADAADRRAPHFSRLWLWAGATCSADAWTAHDEDAYRGPFTRRTAAPVLVVGNYYDPSTPYAGAQAAARLLPNSRLLSGNIWGHTAYGKSACTNHAVNRYLIEQELPAVGTVCHGAGPFDFLAGGLTPINARISATASSPDPDADGGLPPVVALRP